jgi:hypothetical protein
VNDARWVVVHPRPYESICTTMGGSSRVGVVGMRRRSVDGRQIFSHTLLRRRGRCASFLLNRTRNFNAGLGDMEGQREAGEAENDWWRTDVCHLAQKMTELRLAFVVAVEPTST